MKDKIVENKYTDENGENIILKMIREKQREDAHAYLLGSSLGIGSQHFQTGYVKMGCFDIREGLLNPDQIALAKEEGRYITAEEYRKSWSTICNTPFMQFDNQGNPLPRVSKENNNEK